MLASGAAVAAGPDGAGRHVWEFHASSARGRLGAQVLGLTPELRRHFGAPDDRGILVSRVLPDSPAASAGLQVGDVIVAVNGVAIDTAWEVLGATRGVAAGSDVAVDIVRARKPRTLTARLATDGLQGFDRRRGPKRAFPHRMPPLSPDAHGGGGADAAPEHRLPFGQRWFRRFWESHEGPLKQELDATRDRLEKVEKRLLKLEEQRR